MAFGDLTTKNITYTHSTDTGMNLLNKHFGKFSLSQKNNDVAMTNPIKEEPVLENLKKEEGGLETIS